MLLSKATYSHVCIHSTYGWSRELNPLPWRYKRHALPTELQKDHNVFKWAHSTKAK